MEDQQHDFSHQGEQTGGILKSLENSYRIVFNWYINMQQPSEPTALGALGALGGLTCEAVTAT